MGQAAAIHSPSHNDRFSPEEWRLRQDLAAAYRIAAHYKWDDMIATHISVRLPGPEHHFLLNPYGLMFHEVTASSLVKIDLKGNIIGPSPYGVNKAGFNIHSAIHEGRANALCVVHFHTVAGMAVSSQEHGLLPINPAGLLFQGRLAYHKYEGVALNPDEKPRIVADLGDKPALMLHNHGLLTVGPSIGAAMYWMWNLQKACEIQVATLAGGAKQIVPPPEVQATFTGQTGNNFLDDSGTNTVWPAMLRLCDKYYGDYKN